MTICTHEEFLSDIDAILARYISGGFEPDTPQHREALEFLNCPGCRERLGGQLICPCNPELEAAHNNTNEGEGNV